jgi:thiol:disulfide interchange protein DsbC
MLTLAVATSHAASPGLAAVLERLGVDPNADLRPAPVPGFVEVTRGMQVLYVAADGGLVINGDILSIATETNLTEKRRGSIRRDLLDRVAEDETLVARPQVPTLARIIVFTDVDCPYCLALHRRHEELLQQGIEIRYFFYPRSGPESASFEQAVAVWCSSDRLAALGESLRGAGLPDADCDNPVQRHYELAKALELKGTPAVIAADGTVKYGLYSPQDILNFVLGAGRERP